MPLKKQKRRSILHHELHPSVVHFGLGLGGFLSGLLLLSGIAASASSGSISASAEVIQLQTDIASLTYRLTQAESRLAKIDGASTNDTNETSSVASCESLSAVLPNVSWALRTDAINCSQQAAPGSPASLVLSVSAHYQVDASDYTIRVYDLGTEPPRREAYQNLVQQRSNDTLRILYADRFAVSLVSDAETNQVGNLERLADALNLESLNGIE